MPNDLNRISKIRARESSATPGPWYEEGWALENEDGESIQLIDDSLNNGPADAAFIAHARTDIPYLLELLASAESEESELLKEAVNLAQESVRRDVVLAKLEAEVGRLSTGFVYAGKPETAQALPAPPCETSKAVCPTCRNSEHVPGAKYCMICGNALPEEGESE